MSAWKVREHFLRAYEASFGNITKSCTAVGISRQTFYRWKRGTSQIDRRFQRNLEYIRPRELRLDMLESKLEQAALGGSVRAIIFALKTYGRDRGYGPSTAAHAEQELKLDCLVASWQAIIEHLGVRSLTDEMTWAKNLAEAFNIAPTRAWARIQHARLNAIKPFRR